MLCIQRSKMNIKKGKTIIIEQTSELTKISKLLGEMIDLRNKESRRMAAHEIQEQIDLLVIRLNPPEAWSD